MTCSQGLLEMMAVMVVLVTAIAPDLVPLARTEWLVVVAIMLHFVAVAMMLHFVVVARMLAGTTIVGVVMTTVSVVMATVWVAMVMVQALTLSVVVTHSAIEDLSFSTAHQICASRVQDQSRSLLVVEPSSTAMVQPVFP